MDEGGVLQLGSSGYTTGRDAGEYELGVIQVLTGALQLSADVNTSTNAPYLIVDTLVVSDNGSVNADALVCCPYKICVQSQKLTRK